MIKTLNLAQAIGQENRGTEQKFQFRFPKQSNLTKVQHILDKINGDDSSRIVGAILIFILFGPGRKGNFRKNSSKIKDWVQGTCIIPYYPRGEERKTYFLNSYFLLFSLIFSDEDLYVTDLNICPMSQHKQQQNLNQMQREMHSQWREH